MADRLDWPELRTRCARCGMEDHTIEDCHAWCGHAPDAPCTTAEKAYGWCISCGQPCHLPAPDRCLARAAHPGYVPGETMRDTT